ncbi:hypothetical protein GCM10010254_43800 [Streptomyces chromofuscus]|nr:hypothetical protein GCM10010254_43800 [Streptomyces chromofuscus]
MLGQGPGHRGGAGGLGAEDDDAAGEGAAHRRFEELPGAHRVLADRRPGHREAPPLRVDADGHGTEAPGEFVPVRLRGEHGVHTLGHGAPEDRHVRVPHRRIGDVHGDVVDGSHDTYVRMDLPHPRRPLGQRDRLDRRGADQHGQTVAPVGRAADEMVVARVRRIELAEHEPVPEPPPCARRVLAHATASTACGRAASSRRQLSSPNTHRARKPA